MANTYKLQLGSGDATAFQERYGVDPTQQITEDQRASILQKQGAGAGSTSSNFTDEGGFSFSFNANPLAPAPTTPALAEPPISTFTPRTDELSSAIQKGADLSRQQFEQVIDEDAIKQNQINAFQREIDAVNQIYAEQLRQAQIAGEGRLGSGRAIQARSGALGSTFGQSQQNKIGMENTAIEGAIRAEQAAAISAIENKARSTAAAEIKEKRQAQQQGLESYIQYLGALTDRRQDNVNTLVSDLMTNEIDPSTINLEEIAKGYGVSTQEILTKYKQAQAQQAQAQQQAQIADEDRQLKNRKTIADIQKTENDIEVALTKLENELNKPLVISEGQSIIDPYTGELLYKAPKTYAPRGSGGGGTKQKSIFSEVTDLIEAYTPMMDFENEGRGLTREQLIENIIADLDAQGVELTEEDFAEIESQVYRQVKAYEGV